VIAHAQLAMPDPKQMSGIPRPVTDLPDRTVSVRLIRGDLSNNITNFPVELQVGGKARTVNTDASGRALFGDLPAGSTVKAVAVVDGERLESQEFAVPGRGGVRLMLVATDTSKAPATTPNAPPISGQVTIGGQSRVIIEPGDEALQLYYVLEIQNTARAPVNPTTAFAFDMPAGAVGTSVLEGSSRLASAKGRRVTVQGPFPPGRTLVQIACEIATPTGSATIEQRFPAPLEQLSVIVKKVGDTKLSSPQIRNQQEMTAQDERFIAAVGGTIAAGQPLTLTLEEIPHHNPAPRWIALALAALIVAVATRAGMRPQDRQARDSERKRLIAKRDRLFADLVRLEADHRAGRGDPARYGVRRETLMSALEQIYAALDTEDTSPGPAERAA